MIRALTFTFPFFFSLLLAALVRRSGTVIVGGPPEAVEGFRRGLRFFFAAEALSGAAASLTETAPLVLTLTLSLPLTAKLNVLGAGW